MNWEVESLKLVLLFEYLCGLQAESALLEDIEKVLMGVPFSLFSFCARGEDSLAKDI